MEEPNKIFDAKASSSKASRKDVQKAQPLWKLTQDYLVHAASLPKAAIQRLIRDLEVRINEAKLKSQALVAMKQFRGYGNSPNNQKIKHMKRTLTRLCHIHGEVA